MRRAVLSLCEDFRKQIAERRVRVAMLAAEKSNPSNSNDTVLDTLDSAPASYRTRRSGSLKVSYARVISLKRASAA